MTSTEVIDLIASPSGRTAPSVSTIDAYQVYYASGFYDQRYPTVSQPILRRLIADLEGRKRILDFGCGSGRYLVPLLERTNAEIIGFDICPQAIENTRRRLANHPERHRATLICGDFSQVPEVECAVSMFGVMSCIPNRNQRIATLKGIRDRITTPEKRFVLSVSNAYRRLLMDQIARGLNLSPNIFEGEPLEADDVVYKRVTPGTNEEIWMFSHLSRPTTFKAELNAAGFRVRRLSAESVMSQYTVTHSPRLAMIDSILTRIVPAFCGYDMYAVAD